MSTSVRTYVAANEGEKKGDKDRRRGYGST